eukprot:766349-Hanusia_phi.AAC.7
MKSDSEKIATSQAELVEESSADFIDYSKFQASDEKLNSTLLASTATLPTNQWYTKCIPLFTLCLHYQKREEFFACSLALASPPSSFLPLPSSPCLVMPLS